MSKGERQAQPLFNLPDAQTTAVAGQRVPTVHTHPFSTASGHEHVPTRAEAALVWRPPAGMQLPLLIGT